MDNIPYRCYLELVVLGPFTRIDRITIGMPRRMADKWQEYDEANEESQEANNYK